MLFDTSAWIEYFKGTEKGQMVSNLIKNKSIYTCPITLAEISNWSHKNSEGPAQRINIIKSFSSVLELNEQILVLSGRFYAEQRKRNGKISLIDAIIYTTAKIHGLVLLTADGDFENLSSVDFL